MCRYLCYASLSCCLRNSYCRKDGRAQQTNRADHTICSETVNKYLFSFYVLHRHRLTNCTGTGIRTTAKRQRGSTRQRCESWSILISTVMHVLKLCITNFPSRNKLLSLCKGHTECNPRELSSETEARSEGEQTQAAALRLRGIVTRVNKDSRNLANPYVDRSDAARFRQHNVGSLIRENEEIHWHIIMLSIKTNAICIADSSSTDHTPMDLFSYSSSMSLDFTFKKRCNMI